MKSQFLQKQKEANYRPTSPASIELKFNGSAKGGFFTTYDPNVEDKTKRTSKLGLKKNERLTLVFMGHLRQLQGIEKDRKSGQTTITSSNYFLDYTDEHIRLYQNGEQIAAGLYEDIKAAKEETGAKVQSVYFCWAPKLGAMVKFVLRGGMKGEVARFFKQAGGYGEVPVCSVACGELEDGESFDFYHLSIQAEEIASLTDEDISVIDELGPALEEYIEYVRQGNRAAAGPQTPEPSFKDEDTPVTDQDEDEELDDEGDLDL